MKRHLAKLKLRALEEATAEKEDSIKSENPNEADQWDVLKYKRKNRWQFYRGKLWWKDDDGKRVLCAARFCWASKKIPDVRKCSRLPFHRLNYDLEGDASRWKTRWLFWIEIDVPSWGGQHLMDEIVWAAWYDRRRDAKAAAYNRSTRRVL